MEMLARFRMADVTNNAGVYALKFPLQSWVIKHPHIFPKPSPKSHLFKLPTVRVCVCVCVCCLLYTSPSPRDFG